MNERPAKWHQMTADAVCSQLHTSAAHGLSREAARSRLKKAGHNKLFDRRAGSLRQLLWPILSDPACWLMLLVALMSCFFSIFIDAIAFWACFACCIALVFPVAYAWLQYNEKLTQYRIPTTKVIRRGKLYMISARRVAAGDVLLLRAGDIVPCDCRLLSARELRVLTLLCDDKGKAAFAELPKDPDAVYAYASPDKAPYHANMLFGGSEVLAGEARAVAVELGEDTYIGSHEDFVIPAEIGAKASEKDACYVLRPYLRIYGWGMLVLLILCSVIGLLTQPEYYQIMQIFLPLCAMTFAASPAMILFYCRLFRMHAQTHCMAPEHHDNRAVIKSERAMERLSGMTDLLLIGHRGMSDGVPHFRSAAVPSGEIKPDPAAPQSLLQPLCEAFFLSKLAEEGIDSALREDGENDAHFLSELISASLYDLPALRMRLVRAKAIATEGRLRVVDVTLKDRSYQLLFTEDKRLIKRCLLCEDHGKKVVISQPLRERLLRYFDHYTAEAARVVSVARQYPDGNLVLLGAVAMQEDRQDVLPSVIAELEACGVRTTFFLTGERRAEECYADALHLPRPYLYCDDAHPHLRAADLNSARVCIGFSEQDISAVLKEWKREERKAAILGGGADERALLAQSPLVIACDPTEYHHAHVDEVALANQPQDGRERSARSSQALRRHADILIPRADRLGGGLCAILEAFCAAREARAKMRILFSFLCFSQGTRLFAVVVSLLLGIGLWSAAQMLIASVLIEVIATLWILSLPLPVQMRRRNAALDEGILRSVLLDRSKPVALGASILLSWLYLAILVWCGLLPAAAASTATFLGFLLLEFLLFYEAVSEFKSQCTRLKWFHPMLMTLVPIALLIPLSILLPPVNTVTWLGSHSFLSIPVIPLMPLIYLLFRKMIIFFGRTAK